MSSSFWNWNPIAEVYDPILIGSIDGTDTEPHDRGIVRALNSTYHPNKGVIGDPECTLFVGRLAHNTNEKTLETIFSEYGPVRRLRIVRDFVTGFSKGYAFVEFYDSNAADRAETHVNRIEIDGKVITVMFECERTLKGWIPRRLGGGFGGKKESGQLRFGGRDRPFRKPIIMPQQNYNNDWNEEDVAEEKETVDRLEENMSGRSNHRSGSRSNVDERVGRRYQEERERSKRRDSRSRSPVNNRTIRQQSDRRDRRSRSRERSRSRNDRIRKRSHSRERPSHRDKRR